jgi:hypothetical protein
MSISDPDIVCALYRVADAIDEVKIDEFVSTDPRRARWNRRSSVR